MGVKTVLHDTASVSVIHTIRADFDSRINLGAAHGALETEDKLWQTERKLWCATKLSSLTCALCTP